jgi:hypothetical protein
VDRTGTYVGEFKTNHGWITGETDDGYLNGVGSIVEPDSVSISLFDIGSIDYDKGGIGLEKLITILEQINFSSLLLKPAFMYVDSNGNIKLQFEADASSALGTLYDSLCSALGTPDYGNNVYPYNDLGVYSSCTSSLASDRASYGCGATSSEGSEGTGFFCPYATLAYKAQFMTDDLKGQYLTKCNTYIDEWRSKYPNGVALGTSNFCSSGGCLALFLNRFSVYYGFKPELKGSFKHHIPLGGGTSFSSDGEGGLFDKRFGTAAQFALTVLSQVALLGLGLMMLSMTALIGLKKWRRNRRKGFTTWGMIFGGAPTNPQTKGRRRSSSKSRSKSRTRDGGGKDHKGRSSKSKDQKDDPPSKDKRRSKSSSAATSKSKSAASKKPSSSGDDSKKQRSKSVANNKKEKSPKSSSDNNDNKKDGSRSKARSKSRPGVDSDDATTSRRGKVSSSSSSTKNSLRGRDIKKSRSKSSPRSRGGEIAMNPIRGGGGGYVAPVLADEREGSSNSKKKKKKEEGDDDGKKKATKQFII